MRLCERCADKDASNYHAWTHRQWVIQKALHLLQYELHFTEKFIYKHVSDYCCYHHRQFIFKKILECNYYDRDELKLNDIFELVNKIQPPILQQQPNNILKTNNIQVSDSHYLLQVLLPNLKSKSIDTSIDDHFLKFLYFVNLLAYDLKLCKDLNQRFGYYESFRNHYRVILNYIFTYCQLYNKKINVDVQTSSIQHNQPMTKVSKIEEDINVSGHHHSFLYALKKYEIEFNDDFNEHFKQWCQTFLTIN